MKKEIASSRYFLVTYNDSDFVSQVLNNKIQQIQAFAYILHDKDVYLNDVVRDGIVVHKKGDPEIPHIHIYLELFYSRKPSEIMRWFENDDNNTFREFPYSCQSCVDYLTHKNQDEKYQYSQEDVIFYGLKVSDKGELLANTEVLDNSLDILECLLSGKPLRDIVKRFGKEFVYHYASYKDLANDIWRKEIEGFEDAERFSKIDKGDF